MKYKLAMVDAMMCEAYQFCREIGIEFDFVSYPHSWSYAVIDSEVALALMIKFPHILIIEYDGQEI